jgi:nitrate reductase NapD
MPEPAYHISSAVVSVLPDHAVVVLAKLAALDGVEVHAAQGSKIVITIEGANVGVAGDRLTRIACLDGVITASMVYEHIEKVEVAES